MDTFTEKNLNLPNNNNVDIQIIKESEATSQDSDNSSQINLDAGEANIGLDLLANNNKVMKSNVVDDKKNHEEIDLIKNDIEDDSDDKSDKKNNDVDDSESDDESDSDSDSDNMNRQQQHQHNEPEGPSLEDILEEKKKLLYEFERLSNRGIPVSKHFSLGSNIEEMRYELNKIKKKREVDNAIAFSRKMLMAFVTALEFLNNRFDPFDLKLDGWSENVHESVNEYDDIFEELHEKYKSTGKVSPEIKLLLTLGGSAFMFHLTNNIFKSAMPSFESAVGNNPDILNQMMNKNGSSKSSNGGGGGGRRDGRARGGVPGGSPHGAARVHQVRKDARVPARGSELDDPPVRPRHQRHLGG